MTYKIIQSIFSSCYYTFCNKHPGSIECQLSLSMRRGKLLINWCQPTLLLTNLIKFLTVERRPVYVKYREILQVRFVVFSNSKNNGLLYIRHSRVSKIIYNYVSYPLCCEEFKVQLISELNALCTAILCQQKMQLLHTLFFRIMQSNFLLIVQFLFLWDSMSSIISEIHLMFSTACYSKFIN